MPKRSRQPLNEVRHGPVLGLMWTILWRGLPLQASGQAAALGLMAYLSENDGTFLWHVTGRNETDAATGDGMSWGVTSSLLDAMHAAETALAERLTGHQRIEFARSSRGDDPLASASSSTPADWMASARR